MNSRARLSASLPALADLKSRAGGGVVADDIDVEASSTCLGGCFNGRRLPAGAARCSHRTPRKLKQQPAPVNAYSVGPPLHALKVEGNGRNRSTHLQTSSSPTTSGSWRPCCGRTRRSGRARCRRRGGNTRWVRACLMVRHARHQGCFGLHCICFRQLHHSPTRRLQH